MKIVWKVNNAIQIQGIYQQTQFDLEISAKNFGVKNYNQGIPGILGSTWRVRGDEIPFLRKVVVASHCGFDSSFLHY